MPIKDCMMEEGWMGQNVAKLQTKLMREYYKYFSKYLKDGTPDRKIAWVTSFTPVEILEVLDIAYFYPESYAAVIAASGKEQELLTESGRQWLSLDCCAYSCCIEGSVSLGEGPRGTMPRPDILIATNNQCNTLPNWWNILAERYQVPLIILDYPGENSREDIASDYVRKQYEGLIVSLEELSGNHLEMDKLEVAIDNSIKSVEAWKALAGYLATKEMEPTDLFDSISFLITSRCKPDTSELYSVMKEYMEELPEADGSQIPVFWLGYPLWYHPDRYIKEFLEGFRICGSNYITWWNLEYKGVNVMEKLFHAYNYTFLNLSQKTRTERLMECIEKSHAAGAITLHNKSCKCDFVSARDITIPQVELEIDMIDRTFLDVEKARRQIGLLKETLCTI